MWDLLRKYPFSCYDQFQGSQLWTPQSTVSGEVLFNTSSIVVGDPGIEVETEANTMEGGRVQTEL